MTCKDLGGACDTQFQAETFEKMGELSKKHGMEMFKKGDAPSDVIKYLKKRIHEELSANAKTSQ